jgi:acyl carrier protein
MTTTKEEIREFIVNNYLFGQSDAAIKDDDSFLEAGIVDSTGVLELVGFLEENYGIKIQDEDLIPSNLDSINNIVRFIESKLLAFAENREQ